MILFFYGEDTYRLNQKIGALKERFFSASLGDTNLSVLDGEKINFDDFVRQVLALPFLATSRLVIVNSLFLAKKDFLEKAVEFLPKVPRTTVLLVVQEGNPDRRLKLFKDLNKPKISQEFKLLAGDELEKWILAEVKNRGGSIDALAIRKMVEYIGNDLWRMSSELDKLISYDPKISVDSIELLTVPSMQSNIFNLMDQIAAKNIKATVKELNRLLTEGKAEPYILSMIVLEYRNLLIVKDLAERNHGRLNSFAIAKQAKLHPFVAQKTLALSNRYSLEELKKTYGLLSDFDTKIKTGKMESKVALELLVFKLAKSKSI